MRWEFNCFVTYDYLVTFKTSFQKPGNQPKCIIFELGYLDNLKADYANSWFDERGLNMVETYRLGKLQIEIWLNVINKILFQKSGN